uniref:Uncharacterized protein n=1 Tax=Parascaris equorum TaxID=6256 RepID=A0A914RZ99_PAREQ
MNDSGHDESHSEESEQADHSKGIILSLVAVVKDVFDHCIYQIHSYGYKVPRIFRNAHLYG